LPAPRADCILRIACVFDVVERNHSEMQSLRSVPDLASPKDSGC
jgi:hypothetical protein